MSKTGMGNGVILVPSGAPGARGAPWSQAPFTGQTAAFATMHGKEAVVGPVLERALGVRVVQARVDTDRFGTFSREVPRRGSAREVVRHKAEHGVAAVPGATLGVASEGSFGPHPWAPFGPGGVELVVLLDPGRGLEIAGCDVTEETNFGHALVASVEGALAFAVDHGFPSHGMMVLGVRKDRPDPAGGLHKGLVTEAALASAVRDVLTRCGAAHVESDMRAHVNPTRMASIGRAAEDLVRRVLSRCPACGRPGFDVIERLAGLPCEDCGGPTLELRAEAFACVGCGLREERPLSASTSAEARYCPKCNP